VQISKKNTANKVTWCVICTWDDWYV